MPTVQIDETRLAKIQSLYSGSHPKNGNGHVEACAMERRLPSSPVNLGPIILNVPVRLSERSCGHGTMDLPTPNERR